MIYFEFRVHGIQSFIFATNRLKEMVGASALIDQLTQSDIRRAIDKLGLSIKPEDFARCAGGAFLLQIQNPEDAYKLRDFWLMFVTEKIPGLSFSYAICEADQFNDETRTALAEALQRNRCQAVPAPTSGSPFAERAPLTGLPAVGFDNTGRLLDEASSAKHYEGSATGGHLEKKLKFDQEDKLDFDQGDLKYPLTFVSHDEQDDVDTLLADDESDQYIAVIHADVNGLGKVVDSVYQALEKDSSLFPKLPFKFSEAIDNAMRKAVTKASAQVAKDSRRSKFKPHKMLVPMRLLVLGGDDVTLVIKASHALNWVKDFQTVFQQCAEQNLKPFAKYGIPSQLTASAGVVFIKAKQPFHMAYHLAESLCSAAKAAGRADQNDIPTPTVAFHRITTAMIDDWDTIVQCEKTTRDNRVLTMQPYANNDQCNSQLPSLSDLETLSDLLKKVGHGPVRELLKAFHQGKEHTIKSERRLHENLSIDEGKSKLLEKLKQVLIHLHIPQQADSLSLFDAQNRTPLADAVALLAVAGSKEDKASPKQEEVA